MVADFGTYFVGKDRILVHDNSPIPPARLEMPGLLAARASDLECCDLSSFGFRSGMKRGESLLLLRFEPF